ARRARRATDRTRCVPKDRQSRRRHLTIGPKAGFQPLLGQPPKNTAPRHTPDPANLRRAVCATTWQVPFARHEESRAGERERPESARAGLSIGEKNRPAQRSPDKISFGQRYDSTT